MAHIEDRWFTTVKLPGGDTERVKTARHGVGMRYRVRYIAPDGTERKKSFPDRAKKSAEAFLTSVEADKLHGNYIDPNAGKTLFRDYAETWLRTRALDESSREGAEIRVRKHLYPFFGHRALASIAPSDVREWDTSMVDVIAENTRSVTFTHLRTILGAAVDDKKIRANPCSARSVTPPRPTTRKIVPWTMEQVQAIRNALPKRYQAMVDIGSGCGMRQGEILGLAVDDIDLTDGWIHVRRQVKRVRSRLVFGLPKNDTERRIPLPISIATALERHMAAVTPIKVTLPWENPASHKTATARLMFTTVRKNAINRSDFNDLAWHPALAAAGIIRSRATGMHALRHFYASALLDAGETIKALASYLGHADPGFTLRTYTHLMPSSENRTRNAIDRLFGYPTPDDAP